MTAVAKRSLESRKDYQMVYQVDLEGKIKLRLCPIVSEQEKDKVAIIPLIYTEHNILGITDQVESSFRFSWGRCRTVSLNFDFSSSSSSATSSTEGNYRGLETFNCPVYSIGEDRLRESEEDTNSPFKPTIICPGQPRVILSDLLDNFREK